MRDALAGWKGPGATLAELEAFEARRSAAFTGGAPMWRRMQSP